MELRDAMNLPVVCIVLAALASAQPPSSARTVDAYVNPNGRYVGQIKRYHPTTFQASGDPPPAQHQQMMQYDDGSHVGEVQDVNAGAASNQDDSYMPQPSMEVQMDQQHPSSTGDFQMPADHQVSTQDDHHHHHPDQNHDFHGYPSTDDHSHHQEPPPTYIPPMVMGYPPPHDHHPGHEPPMGYLPPPQDHHPPAVEYLPPPEHHHEPSPGYLPPPEDHHPPAGYLPPPPEGHHHHHPPPPGYLPPPNHPPPYPYPLPQYSYGPPPGPNPNPPPPPPPPPKDTSGAAEAPKQQPYTYYYLGRHLWYIPLYFSIYFIAYVGALVLKAIARHKILYPAALHEAAAATRSSDPQVAATARVLDGIHNMTRRYYM